MTTKEHADNLPELADEYSLTSEQIKYYQEKGHICLRGVASSREIAIYESMISNLVMTLNSQDKPLEERDTYGKAFIQVTNLWQRSESISRFVLARRFASIAARLMGVNGVRIYHDQALFKEPGGGHTPWHQDQIYWPLDTHDTITMWMPLIPVSAEMGSMTFASGTHFDGFISKTVISDESHRTLTEYIDGKGLEQLTYGALDVGDATFHAGWTVHSAPNNPSNTMRKVMTVIYYADGTRVAEPDSNARRNDLAAWFPGCQPGELAASHLNPVVYQRD